MVFDWDSGRGKGMIWVDIILEFLLLWANHLSRNAFCFVYVFLSGGFSLMGFAGNADVW